MFPGCPVSCITVIQYFPSFVKRQIHLCITKQSCKRLEFFTQGCHHDVLGDMINSSRLMLETLFIIKLNISTSNLTLWYPDDMCGKCGNWYICTAKRLDSSTGLRWEQFLNLNEAIIQHYRASVIQKWQEAVMFKSFSILPCIYWYS